MKRKQQTTFTTNDYNQIVQRLVSLKDINVLAYHRNGPDQAIEIEQNIPQQTCPTCNQPARVKDRPIIRYVDLPVYGRPMGLLWRKHRWACPNESCAMKSWTSQDKRIAAHRAKMTVRAGKWATEQVGKGRTISEVAKELGCDWHTVNTAVMVYGAALLEADHKRLTNTNAIGLDETSFVRMKGKRTTYATTVCEVENHQIIDILPSRDYRDVAKFLHQQPSTWKRNIRFATLDMSPTYRAVFTVVLPHACQVADHFHVISLANRALDAVRRRVQTTTLGHRGRKADPLYKIRKLLTKAEETLDDKAVDRINAMLALGDPSAEVAVAYRVKERLRDTYKAKSIDEATRMLDELIEMCQRASMPFEIQRLSRSLVRWRTQILAYHQRRLSNSITEAMNNLIKRIKRVGYGFTSFKNYRIRCLLYAGKPNWGSVRFFVCGPSTYTYFANRSG